MKLLSKTTRYKKFTIKITKSVNPEEYVFSRLVNSNLSMRLTSFIAVKIFD